MEVVEISVMEVVVEVAMMEVVEIVVVAAPPVIPVAPVVAPQGCPLASRSSELVLAEADGGIV
jgi:hypothetical protein